MSSAVAIPSACDRFFLSRVWVVYWFGHMTCHMSGNIRGIDSGICPFTGACGRFRSPLLGLACCEAFNLQLNIVGRDLRKKNKLLEDRCTALSFIQSSSTISHGFSFFSVQLQLHQPGQGPAPLEAPKRHVFPQSSLFVAFCSRAFFSFLFLNARACSRPRFFPSFVFLRWPRNASEAGRVLGAEPLHQHRELLLVDLGRAPARLRFFSSFFRAREGWVRWVGLGETRRCHLEP